jgi:hypothetical protein
MIQRCRKSLAEGDIPRQKMLEPAPIDKDPKWLARFKVVKFVRAPVWIAAGSDSSRSFVELNLEDFFEVWVRASFGTNAFRQD